MYVLKLIFFVSIILLSACSDYKSGYREGYDGGEQRQWIVLGRTDYQNGYHAGQAERFQDDWLLENPIKESLMQCPSIIVKANPLMLLPDEYKSLGQGIYSRIE